MSGKVFYSSKDTVNNNTCAHKYSVFFSRNGYAEIMAKSPEEARRIGDEELKYNDVSWDDDWNVTDVQIEE